MLPQPQQQAESPLFNFTFVEDKPKGPSDNPCRKWGRSDDNNNDNAHALKSKCAKEQPSEGCEPEGHGCHLEETPKAIWEQFKKENLL